MVLAAAFIAASTLCAKLARTDALGEPIAGVAVANARFLAALTALLVVAAIVRPRFTAPAYPLHAARSAAGFLGVTAMFTAVAFLPLGDVTAISFLNPVFAMMLAIPLLGERVGPWRAASAAIALTGAFVLMRPSPEAFEPAALIALAAAMALGLEVVFIKRLAGREGPFQILIINNAIGATLSTLAAVAFWTAPTAAQGLALAGVGLFMVCAQTCFVNALARADASFAVPFTYATLVFATLLDNAAFGEVPDAVSYVGAGLIVAGAALLLWREGRARKGPTASASALSNAPTPPPGSP